MYSYDFLFFLSRLITELLSSEHVTFDGWLNAVMVSVRYFMSE